MEKKVIITIGRQFGSGGREFGQLLAKSLGIDYYDKKLLIEGAREAGYCEEYFENQDEKVPSFFKMISPWIVSHPAAWYGAMGGGCDDSTYVFQSNVIRKAAEKGSCVIVGRTADYVLRDCPNAIHIFIHAPIEDCAKRVFERGEAKSMEAAIEKAKKINKLRANYYNFYTDKTWGDAASYDLTFDSSKIPFDVAVELVKEVIKARGLELRM